MVHMLKTSHPIARKEHRCMYCGEKIILGQKYDRTTFVYDGIYDWIAHEECVTVASELDMYSDCDDNGLDGESFREYLDQYVYDNHYDNIIEDIAEDWEIPYYDKVKKILEELKYENLNGNR